MKTAFSTLGCPDWDFETVVKRAHGYGFDGIEIRGILRQFDLTQVPELTGGLDDARRLLDEHHVRVAGIGASSTFSSDDEAQRRANLESARAHLDIARGVGARCVRVFGGNLPEGVERERAEDYIAACLRELGDDAAEAGVQVALETHDAFSLGAQAAAVLDKTDHPMVGVLWDLHHTVAHGEAPEETMRLLSGRVVAVHVKDGNFEHYTLLGEGRIPTLKMLRLLKADGYDGYLSVEWEKAWHPELADPEVAFPQYVAKLHEYLSVI